MHPSRLSRRTSPFEESVIREMTRLGDETGAINLSQGLPDFDTPEVILDAAVQAIQSGTNQYSFPFGNFQLRAAIAAKNARYNKISSDPDSEITVTCGVSEAIMASIFALTEPGDEIILFEPWYENYLPACTLAGVLPKYVKLHEPEYTFDPKELASAFTNRTRLVIINTPHNPTGKIFTRSELKLIALQCQSYDVIALTDEIYEYIIYDDNEHISIGSLPGMENRTVSISGLGKTYGLTGWRIGWATAIPEITGLIRKVHDYFTICAPTPLQSAAVVALEMPLEFYVNLQAVYESRRKILLDFISGTGLTYYTPQGAYYVMVNFENIAWDIPHDWQSKGTMDRAFAEYMAREIGVAVVPASSFYTTGKDQIRSIRINFARRPEILIEAGVRLNKLGLSI